MFEAPVVEEQPSAVAAPPVHPAVVALQRAVAGLARAQSEGSLAAGSLADTAALVRAAESVQGLAAREVAAVDRTQSYLTVGRASAAGWLGSVLPLDDAACRARVRLAQRLDTDLRRVGDLLVDGGTTLAHARALQVGLRGIGPDVVEASQGALVVLAQRLDPPTLARELRERAHAVSDELAREAERRQAERVGVRVSELADGCVRIDGLLAPEEGQALLTVLDAHVAGTRESGDRRDNPARRAEALGALAHHALGCPDGALPSRGGSRAQVLVLVEAERLERAASGCGSADLDEAAAPATFPGSNALLSDRALLRLSCDADISRVVLGSDGTVLDLGRLTRTVSPAQMRALVARDQTCVITGCRRRHGESQAHHVRHWARGGPSDLANYALVCHQHHHELHDGERRLQHRDGRWLTPDGYEDPGPEPPVF